jgi:hypothetical protein
MKTYGKMMWTWKPYGISIDYRWLIWGLQDCGYFYVVGMACLPFCGDNVIMAYQEG